MKILILGGTGAMGIHLVNILASVTENEVFVTTRKTRTSSKENIIYFTGDAHNSEFITSVLTKENWDAIIDFMVYNTEEFTNRVDLFLSSCKQYVFLSSSTVYANSNEPITEKSPRLLDVSNDEKFLATDLYPLTKARQENILFENEKKNWTIIRPYITYSENRLQLGVLEKETWLFTALNCEALVFSKDISRHITTLTYAFDVARGITAIIGNEKAYGEAFHITGSKTIKWQEVFNLYSQVLRSNGVKIEEIMKEKTHRLDYDWSKYQVLYDRYFDRVFDNSKIAQFVDVDSFVKPEEGLRNCLEKLIKEPCFNYVAVDGVLLVLQGTKKKLRLKKIPQIKQKIKFILIKLHMYPL